MLSLSGSSGTRYYNTELQEKTVNWDGIIARKAAEGWTLCPGEPVLKYDAVLNQFVWVKYFKKDDIVCEYRVAVSKDSSYNIDEECYYQGMPTAESYSYDFYFKNDIPTVEWTVHDYYDNEVTLPMAYEQGKGYYLLDKKRKIVGIDYSDSLVPRYFQNQGELAKYYSSVCLTMKPQLPFCFDKMIGQIIRPRVDMTAVFSVWKYTVIIRWLRTIRLLTNLHTACWR